jgi:hypothetical protein
MTSQQKNLNDLRGKMTQSTSPTEKMKLARLARKERIGTDSITGSRATFGGLSLADLKIVGVH